MALERYKFHAVWSTDDGEYVGICAEFPALSWLDKTEVLALAGIREMVSCSVAEMIEVGEVPPMSIVR